MANGITADRHRYDPLFGLPKEITPYLGDRGESTEHAYGDLKIVEGWTWASSDDGHTTADIDLLNSGDKTVVDLRVEVLLYDNSGEYIGSMMRRFMDELPSGTRRSYHIERLRPKRAYGARVQLSEIRTVPEEITPDN